MPLVQHPPRVATLVVEEEEAATSKMRGQGSRKKELGLHAVPYWPLWKPAWVHVVYQTPSHEPSSQDVQSREDQGPADLSAFVDLLFCLRFSHRHCDPGVGEHMEEPASEGRFPVDVFIERAACNRDPPEDDRHGEEKRGMDV